MGQDVEAVAHANQRQRETDNVLGECAEDVPSHDLSFDLSLLSGPNRSGRFKFC
jgi:hypothetical protein